MESRAHALAAGLFLLLMSVAVGLAIWYLSSGDDAGQEYLLVTTADVGGLSPQAQVRYRGIRVGKVRDISINPDDPREIHVRISIPARYPVTAGTRAELGYLGVTGLALIEMTDDGSDPTPLSPADAFAFPHAILEIKLQDKPPAWLDELLRLPQQPMLETRRIARASVAECLRDEHINLPHFLAGWMQPDTQAALRAMLARIGK